MNSTCARASCHGKGFVVGLDLRPDEGFVTRTRSVPAMFGGISCPDDPLKECVPATCPPGAELIDAADPASSWILLKSLGTHGACGGFMPYGGTSPLTGDSAACLANIVNAVATLP